jgi:hypothetical protein
MRAVLFYTRRDCEKASSNAESAAGALGMLVIFRAGLRLFQNCLRHSFTGYQASRLSPLVLHHNSKAVHGPVELIRNPHIQPAGSCGETSKRRKESSNSSSNSCQCFCVMDAPEICQAPGLVVVSEFLTAVQASDVSSSAIERSASGQVGGDRLAQRHRRTLMLMAADKSKTKQCP